MTTIIILAAIGIVLAFAFGAHVGYAVGKVDGEDDMLERVSRTKNCWTTGEQDNGRQEH